MSPTARVNPLSLLNPFTTLEVAGRAFGAVQDAIALVPRLTDIVGRVESLIGAVERVVAHVETTQDKARAVAVRADGVVTQAAAVTGRTATLLDSFEPSLRQLEPVLARVAESTDPREVDAMVELVDLLPEVVTAFRTDILPILNTMQSVGPDIRDLLEVSKQLNEMLGALPGLGRVKRKIDEQQELQDADAPPQLVRGDEGAADGRAEGQPVAADTATDR